MALSDAERLRGLLGEPIEEGGSDEDTLFTNDAIEDLLAQAGGNLNRAAYEGWRYKAAHFAGLVDVTDGNASRAMSDLLTNANRMLTNFSKASGSTLPGRTRVGRIRRAT